MKRPEVTRLLAQQSSVQLVQGSHPRSCSITKTEQTPKEKMPNSPNAVDCRMSAFGKVHLWGMQVPTECLAQPLRPLDVAGMGLCSGSAWQQ